MKYLIILLFSISALSRPVGYQGAINGLSFTKGNRTENTIHYSPKYYYSVGSKSFSNNDFSFNGVYGSYLAKRINLKDSQANLFTYGSVGYQNNNTMYNYAIQADYETRSFYTLYSYQVYENNLFFLNNNIARLGFAPYEASYKEINTWLIAEYNSVDKNTTPLIRNFYKNVLWEVGYNKEEQFLFNLMFQVMY